MRLDIGSGHIYREGFERVDIDPDAHVHYRCLAEDVETLINPGSVDEIYSAHCLEHVAYKDCFRTLRAFWRILKPGGKITIIVPDIEYALERYIRDRNWLLLERTILGADPDATEWMVHRNLFSYKKLNRFLKITGFHNISADQTPDSNIITIKAEKYEEDVDND